MSDLAKLRQDMRDAEAAAAVLAFYAGKPERWTQAAFARDETGRSLTSVNVAAGASWCLVGACRVLDIHTDALARELGFARVLDMEHWNDDEQRTFAEVESRLRAAAEGGDRG